MTSALALVFALLAPSSGSAILELTVSPSDASIYVDGKKTRPIKKRIKLAPGSRTLKVSRKGYRTVQRTLKLAKGKVLRLKISLTKSTAKKPVATKKPAKRPAKRPVATKKPTRRPVKKPVATRKPGKRPIKKPRAKPKPRKKPTVGRRPSKKPSPRPSARPRGPQPVRDDTQPAPPSYRGYAIVSFLVGGAAIAGGAYMGSQADESADAFNRSVDRFDKQELQDDTEFQATAANVLYGVGAAGVVLGALLWAAEPDYRYSVGPMPGGGTYVGLEGRF